MSRRGFTKMLPAFLLVLALLADNPRRIFADEGIDGSKTSSDQAAEDQAFASDGKDHTTVAAAADEPVELVSIVTSNNDATTTTTTTTTTTAAPVVSEEAGDDYDDMRCSEPGMVLCDAGESCYHEHEDRCNGLAICVDDSDELGCDLICKEDEFKCADQSGCIPLANVCDGFEDCLDDSDEFNCTESKPCDNPDDFQCRGNGQCIQGHLRCDNEEHCPDGSDEIDCHHEHPAEVCPHDFFDCSGDGGHCIEFSKRCDKREDCPKGEDELNCTDEHVDQVENKGETLVDCDHDEYNCHHICQKIDGDTNHHSRKICSCFEGYVLAEDKFSCHFNGDEPQMWMADGKTLVKYALYKKSVLSRHDMAHNVSSFAYDFQRGHLFWLPDHADAIAMSKMAADGSYPTRPVFLARAPNIHRPVALAYDWISQNLYWADRGRSHQSKTQSNGTEISEKEAEEIRQAFGPKIGVISIGKQSEKGHPIIAPVVRHPHVTEPNALVVDPRPGQGFIYWTQVGKERGLYKAGADGSKVATLRKQSVVHPKALTIDYFYNCLYWVDDDKLYTSKFTGDSRVLYTFEPFDIPNVFASFEGEIYWKDAISHSIMEHFSDNVHYRPASLPGTASESSKFIAVYHSTLQSKETGLPCQTHHGNCSHLCLSAPRYEGYTCVCHDSPVQKSRGILYKLADDGKACVRETMKASEDNAQGRVPPGLDTKSGGAGESDYMYLYLDEDEVANRRKGVQALPGSPEVTEKKDPEKFTNNAGASTGGAGTSSVWIYFIAAVAGVAVVVAVVFVSIRYKRWKELQKVENEALGTPLKSSQDAPSSTGTNVTANTTTNLLV